MAFQLILRLPNTKRGPTCFFESPDKGLKPWEWGGVMRPKSRIYLTECHQGKTIIFQNDGTDEEAFLQAVSRPY